MRDGRTDISAVTNYMPALAYRDCKTAYDV